MEILFAALAELIIQDLSERPRIKQLRTQLQGGSPVERALQAALNEAYRIFANKYPGLSSSFFDEDFLKNKDVCSELGKLLTPQEKPRLEVIDQVWKEQFKSDQKSIVNEIEFFTEQLRISIQAQIDLKPFVDSQLMARSADANEDTRDAVKELVNIIKPPNMRALELEYLQKIK